jgi:hypothetical protein
MARQFGQVNVFEVMIVMLFLPAAGDASAYQVASRCRPC